MNIPIKPSKPVAPKKIISYKNSDLSYSMDRYTSLTDILKYFEELCKFEKLKFSLDNIIFDLDYDGDYPNNIAVYRNESKTEYPNPKHDKQYKKYLEKLDKYNADKEEYDKQMIEYNRWLKETEIANAKKILEKYGEV